MWNHRKTFFSWIEKFITNRHQFVNIKGFHSVLALVISGVPQGTVLGPILFLIYINDLKKCLKSSSASSFADDTRLSQQIACFEDHHSSGRLIQCGEMGRTK